MRMTMIALLITSLPACIYYQGDGEDPWPWERPDDDVDDTGAADDTDVDDTGAADDTDEPTPSPSPFELDLLPHQATAGSMVLASLIDIAENDLRRVEDVRFFGPVTVHAVQARPDEVLLSLSIAADAAPGWVDLLADLDDGMSVYLPAALEILPSLDPEPDPCTCP